VGSECQIHSTSGTGSIRVNPLGRCRRVRGAKIKDGKALSYVICLIDNYDSFTFNLVHYFGELGAEVVVHRNDKITSAAVLDADPDAIVLSPGPCTPKEAGICLDLIAKAAETIPILGVCLGHQAIGDAFGGKVVRAPSQVHGKLSEIRHKGTGLFRGINAPFKATRYHSLVVERESLPRELAVTAETDGGVIMGLAHETLPVHGVQFHPESIASEHGHLMLKNFLDIAAAWNETAGRRSDAPQPAQKTQARANQRKVPWRQN
jgi:anthranilate synthase component II